eukprot:1863159-Rhodomonas_salina.1
MDTHIHTQIHRERHTAAGTDAAYAATRALRVPYAVSGTDAAMAYGARERAARGGLEDRIQSIGDRIEAGIQRTQ